MNNFLQRHNIETYDEFFNPLETPSIQNHHFNIKKDET